MKISEIITDKYKLRIPPTVYYELLADVQEVEEEQDPFMATPCISSRVCEHDRVVTLDKIRAEIAELWHYYPMGHDYEIAINRCLAVIDKYKAETEES